MASFMIHPDSTRSAFLSTDYPEDITLKFQQGDVEATVFITKEMAKKVIADLTPLTDPDVNFSNPPKLPKPIINETGDSTDDN